MQAMGLREPRVDELAPIFVGMNEDVFGENFETLDTVLRNTDVTTISSTMIVALGRGTFAHRRLLRSWPDYIERSKIELGKRGLDAEKVLRGLKL